MKNVNECSSRLECIEEEEEGGVEVVELLAVINTCCCRNVEDVVKEEGQIIAH